MVIVNHAAADIAGLEMQVGLYAKANLVVEFPVKVEVSRTLRGSSGNWHHHHHQASRVGDSGLAVFDSEICDHRTVTAAATAA